MRVNGRIVATSSGRAKVECVSARAAGCPACAGGHGCSWQRPLPRYLDVEDGQCETALDAGDAVEIVVADRALLGAALRAYVPPVAGLVAMPSAWQLLGGAPTGDGGMAVAALIGFAGGIVLARRLTHCALPAMAIRRAGR